MGPWGAQNGGALFSHDTGLRKETVNNKRLWRRRQRQRRRSGSRPDHFSAGCWSEDETIGPGVPRKLVFALHVRVSRNRSRSFISPPRVLRSATPRASRNASGASLRLPHVLHFRASPPTVHMHERSFICNGLTTFQMPAPPLRRTQEAESVLPVHHVNTCRPCLV